jgi:CheY-like chemotaxis protein
MLRSAGVAPSSLLVEVTESTLMRDPERAMAVLNELHDLGVGVVIDDFGTGYSSLAYLRRLPVDEIKIDRSFVQSMTHNGLVIVRSVIDLGRNLGLEVTAEGVENREAWDALARMGCTMAQGYYLSRPLPAEDLIPWIATFSRTTEPMVTRGNVILVVDDNPVYQELLQALLTGEGYEVVIAGRAEDALATLETLRPDLILTDVQLPDLDGLELVRHIRSHHDLKESVILALTGSPNGEDEKRARSAGCDVYTARPSSNADLLGLVRQYLAA